MKVSYHTLGCRTNAYDTQAILANMKEHGFDIMDQEEETSGSDVIIINTCAVTNESERKSRQLVRKYKRNNPNAIVVVTGCVPQTNIESIKKMVEADIICGTHNRNQIPMLVKEFIENRKNLSTIDSDESEDYFVTHFENKTRATVKIQDGCTMFCTYCIIPFARGKLRSVSHKKILNQIVQIADEGYNEVVLTGIHLSSYCDEDGLRLIDLLEKIDELHLIGRVRLGSLEPKYLTPKVIDRLSKLNSFCPNFHISLQSGCDKILKLMNRHYTTEEYTIICSNIKEKFPTSTITTDVIVGFPSENEDDFIQTLEFIQQIGFYHVHVFPYSPKEGTAAALMKGQNDKATKQDRARRLIEVSERLQQNIERSMDGLSEEVLYEQRNSDGYYEGYTRNYIKVKSRDKNIVENEIYEHILEIDVENGEIWGK